MPKHKVPFKACCCISMLTHQLVWDHLITVLLQLILLQNEVLCFHLEIAKRQTLRCVRAKEALPIYLPIKPQIWMSCSQGKGVRLKDTFRWTEQKPFAGFVCVLVFTRCAASWIDRVILSELLYYLHSETISEYWPQDSREKLDSLDMINFRLWCPDKADFPLQAFNSITVWIQMYKFIFLLPTDLVVTHLKNSSQA